MRSALLLLLLLPLGLWAQQDSVPIGNVDTVAIPSVEVNAYSTPQPIETTTNAIAVIGSTQLESQANNTSFVSVVNQVPGVRMEERSPGSYRISMRGSLLRSPFGIRNVKFYLMSELPFTDASGNTYFNLFDYSGVNKIDLVKGPDASIFGANAGGVMVLYPNRNPKDTSLTIHLAGGSFGYAKEDIGYKKVWKKYSLQINQAYQRSDGYRRNSQMQRHFVQAIQQWQYRPKMHFTAYHLLANIHYETPGGLTKQQAEADPTAARAPTATLPGASQQQAGIYNTTTYHGFIHEWSIKKGLRHVVSAFGSFTDFKNPFITNYEIRKEYTLGTRTYIDWKPKTRKGNNLFSWTTGYEYLFTGTDFKNYDNLGGTRGALRVADELKAQQQFFFTKLSKTFYERVYVDASLSVNFFNYHFQNQHPVAAAQFEGIAFKPQLMPRLGINAHLLEHLWVRANVSRGYSPPTLAEIRPSTNVINTNLQAESGWNYELGLFYAHYGWRKPIFTIKPMVYYFQLKDAIVRREDGNGAEYFINAGGTKQIGLDVSTFINLTPKRGQWINELLFNSSYTYQHFKFDDYKVGNEDYDGNWLTGVPQHKVWAAMVFYFKKGLGIDFTYTFTSTIPLNDANEVYANSYHLLQARISYKLPIKKHEIELYLSGDNLLNQKYSLGNDINAFGGRYYNPAPTINFLGGVRVKI